jgi:MFS family permease
MAVSDPTPLVAEPQACLRRRLALAAAVVFVISSAFPVVAGLAKNPASFPKWWGVADVAIAFVLAFLAIVISALVGHDVNKQAEEASYRAYRFLMHGILAMVVAFFLFGDWITWSIWLVGLGWRTWLLLYSLPAWFTALRSYRPGCESQPD